METGDLLQLARRVLSLPEGDDQLGALEEYVEALEGWLKEHDHELRIKKNDICNAAEVEDLVKSHAEVMCSVQALLTNTSDKLGELRRRAKAIMAYVDVLPKKISMSGTRKG